MDEKMIQQLNEARMISTCEHIIFPLLLNMIDQRLEMACSVFRGGKQETFTSDIAYITALKDILNSIKSRQTAGNKVYTLINSNKI